jgi:hypothetical protein
VGTRAPSETRLNYRREFFAQIDRTNKESCLKIAELYGELEDKSNEKKYWGKAKQ